ncbi:MAG: cupin domain-containing protein [Candidatus Rokuibacteriota bacterium]
MAIVNHRDVPTFELQGNLMIGVATPSHGARQVEAWYTTLAPGAATPPHVHDAEEIVVVLRGRGELRVGEGRLSFEAPCTLIAPAGVCHQILNTGEETVEAVAAMPLGSTISDADGAALELPWRR